MPATENSRPVYTTGIGRVQYCARCGQPREQCRCRAEAARAERPGMPRDGVVRVTHDRKGRGGKSATLITGLPDDPELLATLCTRLKKLCSAGGTIKGDEILIQGEFRDKIAAELKKQGYTVKLVGG